MKIPQYSWTPTATLAQLFEEQNQFYDALATYELIAQNDSSPAIREKIEALHARILNDSSNIYDSRIEKLFTPEELAYLKVLSHQGFDNMSRAIDRLNEGIEDSQLVFEEEEVLADDKELDALFSVLSEIEKQTQVNLATDAEGIDSGSVQDLIISVLSRFDKNTLLKDIPLSDFLSIFVDMQNPKK